MERNISCEPLPKVTLINKTFKSIVKKKKKNHENFSLTKTKISLRAIFFDLHFLYSNGNFTCHPEGCFHNPILNVFLQLPNFSIASRQVAIILIVVELSDKIFRIENFEFKFDAHFSRG